MKIFPKRHPIRKKPIRFAIGVCVRVLTSVLNVFVRDSDLDPSSVEITRLTVNLPRLAPAFDGYRLVQISDIHIGTWMNRKRLAQIVHLVNQQKPDLIAITGDFVSYVVDPHLDDLIIPLRELQSKDATLAVLGNHDHWTDPEKVRMVLRESGIIEIGNDVYTLRRREAALHLAGVDDYYDGADRLDVVLARLPKDGAAILLAHEPDFADISAATGRFGLQISGHSHGGQIVLPVIGPPMLPTFGQKYPSGRYQINGMVQYTNRGLGTSLLRLRYRCSREVTVFELRAPGDRPVAARLTSDLSFSSPRP